MENLGMEIEGKIIASDFVSKHYLILSSEGDVNSWGDGQDGE